MEELDVGGLLDMYSIEELINELSRRQNVEITQLDFGRGYSLVKDYDIRRIVVVYTKPDKPIKKRKYIKY